MTSQATETWVPHCPMGCGSGTLILAPANGFTKHIITEVEVYCTNCQYRGKLKDDLKKIYTRI